MSRADKIVDTGPGARYGWDRDRGAVWCQSSASVVPRQLGAGDFNRRSATNTQEKQGCPIRDYPVSADIYRTSSLHTCVRNARLMVFI